MLPPVSIVIPFYNEEQYLERAILSAIRQSYSHVEVILVNDGSTDLSLSIAQEAVAVYKNTKLISTSNQGLGHARNTGMAEAKGAYIVFLDSDDELKEHAIATWIKKIQEEEADIVIGRFSMVKKDSKEYIAGWNGDGHSCTAIEGIKAMYEHRLSVTAWAKLFRTEIAVQLKFPEGVWFEDRPFLLSYLLQAKKVAFETTSQVNILSRQHSITRRLISTRRIKDAALVYQLELNMVKGYDDGPLMRLIDRHHINTLMEALIIFYFDRKAVPDTVAVQKCFTEQVQSFKKQLKDNGTRLGLRDKSDLLLLQLPLLLGWQTTFLLLPLWKRKKCASVLRLKSF